MKIHYIGNFLVPFTTESHVALSLESLGHEVVRHQENEIDWPHASLIAKRMSGDLLLWTHTHSFADESTHDWQDELLDGLRERSIPSVAFHLDRWWGLSREDQVLEPFFSCDLVCTADGGRQADWESIGVNHAWLPPAVVHTEVGRGTVQSRYRKDVGFVGSWLNYGHRREWPWRFELVSHLHKTYGSRFRSWPRGGRPVRGRQLNDIYASVGVVVGDSCLAGGATHYWSDRVPETIGRGGFLLHPDVPGLSDHFDPDLLPWTYEVGNLAHVDHQIEQALALSESERDHLIDRSIEHVRARHTYRVRMEQLLQLVAAL